ncbi:MAG: HTTM domain-containing protein [Myxococcota bacterium]
MATELRERLTAPVDAASLGVFRAGFGLMMLVGVIRYWSYGWIEQLYIEPDFFFPYWGFEWLQPWPGVGMYVHYALLGVLAFLIMVGLGSRVALLLYFLGFTYVELLDRTAYLNHYYLISILSLLMAFLPVDRAFSLSRRLGWQTGPETTARWSLYAVRLQVGLVYVFAGIAKLRADWLLRGEPLHTWLSARTDIPLVGPYLAEPALAIAASWAGACFDLFIVAFLLWPKTRKLAYLAVIGFHLVTGYLFNIGVFPFVMIFAATILFEPDWPRRFIGGPRDSGEVRHRPVRRLTFAVGASLLAVHFVFQLAFPMRTALYPGNALWTEQGYRFGWRVMLMEKTGEIDMRVVDNRGGRTWMVTPRNHMTRFQYQEMSTQPDMILSYAHHLVEQWRDDGFDDVSVYADAWAVLNGRPRQRLIDPTVDLAKQQDGWAPKAWIVPLEPDDEGEVTDRATTTAQAGAPSATP